MMISMKNPAPPAWLQRRWARQDRWREQQEKNWRAMARWGVITRPGGYKITVMEELVDDCLRSQGIDPEERRRLLRSHHYDHATGRWVKFARRF